MIYRSVAAVAPAAYFTDIESGYMGWPLTTQPRYLLAFYGFESRLPRTIARPPFLYNEVFGV